MRFAKVKWSPIEEEYLRKHRKDPRDQLCIALAKSRNAIKKKLDEFDGKISKKQGAGKGRISYSHRRKDCDNLFMRSRWEANFYRYLKQHRKDVASVEYEPRTFLFTDWYKRGTLSYTPDFKITFRDGSYIWVEVKGGMMPPKDKTKIRRFKKYYPEEAANLVALTPGKTTKVATFFKSENIPIRWYYPTFQKRWRKRIVGWEG